MESNWLISLLIIYFDFVTISLIGYIYNNIIYLFLLNKLSDNLIIFKKINIIFFKVY